MDADTTVVRVTPGVHWHALEDDVVVGRGHALHRPDGHVFVSVDSWRDDVFETLALAMIDDLGCSVHTLVSDDDREFLARWSALGFRDQRREVEYLVATEAAPRGLPLPPGLRIVGPDDVDASRAGEGESQLRPSGFSGGPIGPRGFAPSLWFAAVADEADVEGGEYVAVARICGVPRRPRLGFVGVRPTFRRRGLATALLVEALDTLRGRGVARITAEVDELDEATRALLATAGAQETGRAVELVRPAGRVVGPGPALRPRSSAGPAGVGDARPAARTSPGTRCPPPWW